MRNGEIKTHDGKTYRSVADYIKVFKSFWHWYQKVNKKNGNGIIDITEDLDTSSEKPKWVYLDEDQVKKLCNKAKPEYRVFIMFLFDTGMRAPSELINIKVSDFLDDYKELFIRDEISKTFGRRIKLLISSELVRDFVKENNLEQDDYLFKISPSVVNRYLRRLALKVFGEGVSLAGEKYSNLTMYDFGHVSCCYWLPRYKSESALKYRFDWKKSDKIHYYSELLGMKDTIQEEDLLIDVTKTEIEKRLISSERDNEVLKERVASMEGQMKEILGEVRNITNRLDR
jgi:integrase